MGGNSINGLRNACCWTTSSSQGGITDGFLRVSKKDLDEMYIEKIQANAKIQRMEMVNEKLTRNLSELQAKLAENEQKIFRFEAKFKIGYAEIAKSSEGKAESEHSTENVQEDLSMDQPPQLTKKKTHGIEFEKYLIKDGQGTLSGFRFPIIADNDENVTESWLKEDVEKDELPNTSNNSKNNVLGYDSNVPRDKAVSAIKFSFIVSEVSEDEEDSSIWFYK